jgi:hypothetical protein
MVQNGNEIAREIFLLFGVSRYRLKFKVGRNSVGGLIIVVLFVVVGMSTKISLLSASFI